eukprot:m.117367 g.117367  ORF g.117367 m.117367 type:complete len:807 (+) comp14249_c0_seq2:379-2799(+)
MKSYRATFACLFVLAVHAQSVQDNGRQGSSSKELNQLRVHVEAQKQSLTSLHTAYKELLSDASEMASKISKGNCDIQMGSLFLKKYQKARDQMDMTVREEASQSESEKLASKLLKQKQEMKQAHRRYLEATLDHLEAENDMLRHSLVVEGMSVEDIDEQLCDRLDTRSEHCKQLKARREEKTEVSEEEMEERERALEDLLISPHRSEPNQNPNGAVSENENIPCELFSYIQAPTCGERSRKANMADLLRCRDDICKQLPQWGIAHASDGTIHGSGYECNVDASVSVSGGESICVSSNTEINEIATGQCDEDETTNAYTNVDQNNNVGGATDGEELNEELVHERREYIRDMMKTAWRGYAKHAWGENELRPASRTGFSQGIFGSTQMGATIVDALDTLKIMGLDEELEQAEEWVEKYLNFDVDTSVSVFEVTIRHLGGLLSAWSLTQKKMYLDKAEDLAQRLLPAFKSKTGVPMSTTNLRSGVSSNWNWQPANGKAILSEFGGMTLEWEYLSEATQNPLYGDLIGNSSKFILEQKFSSATGLPPNWFDTQGGTWGPEEFSLGPYGDSWYEYLLKSWVLQGGSKNHNPDPIARSTFDDVIANVRKHLHHRSQPSGMLYLADHKKGRVEHHMWHLSCFAPGMYALSAMTSNSSEEAAKYMQDAVELTATCRNGYELHETKLGPEKMEFKGQQDLTAHGGEFFLRPETMEAYFYLWRTTHDNKYREWAWDAAKAIETHCRCGDGYCGVRNVAKTPADHDDIQQSFFLAETLKYLYLIFSDDSVMNLSEWVFNTEAHPFPIRGTRAAFKTD